MNDSTNSDNMTSQENQNSSPESSESDETKKHSQSQQRSNEESKFREGQKLQLVRVRFPGNSRSFPFLFGKRKLAYGQKVVAMSDRGMAVGYVNSFPYQVSYHKNMGEVRHISKVATEDDIRKQQESYRKEKQVETLCKELIEKHRLDMNLTHVEFTQFGKKVVFYFNAPARVDFRALVKELVHELKLRIELRQISVRDRAASVGGIGPCGRELCCSSFLSRYGNVTIKMAKSQNLSLTSNKLNGVCGQLKCCLQYEDDVYEQKRKKLPKERELVFTHTGDRGKVIRLHVLSEQFDMLNETGSIRRYTVDQYKRRAPKDFVFPEHFDHISDETETVVGLSEYMAKKTKDFENDTQKLKEKAPAYADTIYQDVFAKHYFREDTQASKESESEQQETELT